MLLVIVKRTQRLYRKSILSREKKFDVIKQDPKKIVWRREYIFSWQRKNFQAGTINGWLEQNINRDLWWSYTPRRFSLTIQNQSLELRAW